MENANKSYKHANKCKTAPGSLPLCSEHPSLYTFRSAMGQWAMASGPWAGERDHIAIHGLNNHNTQYLTMYGHIKHIMAIWLAYYAMHVHIWLCMAIICKYNLLSTLFAGPWANGPWPLDHGLAKRSWLSHFSKNGFVVSPPWQRTGRWYCFKHLFAFAFMCRHFVRIFRWISALIKWNSLNQSLLIWLAN